MLRIFLSSVALALVSMSATWILLPSAQDRAETDAGWFAPSTAREAPERAKSPQPAVASAHETPNAVLVVPARSHDKGASCPEGPPAATLLIFRVSKGLVRPIET